MAAMPYLGSRGRPAASNYEVVEPLAGGAAALVQWRLETGRTHQIRQVPCALCSASSEFTHPLLLLTFAAQCHEGVGPLLHVCVSSPHACGGLIAVRCCAAWAPWAHRALAGCTPSTWATLWWATRRTAGAGARRRRAWREAGPACERGGWPPPWDARPSRPWPAKSQGALMILSVVLWVACVAPHAQGADVQGAGGGVGAAGAARPQLGVRPPRERGEAVVRV